MERPEGERTGHVRTFLLALLILFGCGCDDSAGTHVDPLPDAEDGAGGSDPADAGGDAGQDAIVDGGPDTGVDAGGDTGFDAGEDPSLDGGSDAGLDEGDDMGPDAGPDAGADAGGDPEPDAGVDAGGDTGPDAGPDGGADATDAGADESGEDTIWIEIDYASAYTPQSPDWSFSDTPGWGPAQWAMEGDTWPEAWDRWNNMQVVDDPIGRALEIGPGSELQLMLGLEELASYESATVTIHGRARECCSSTRFDVLNPWNGCGTSGTLGQQWEVQIVELDLDACMVPGQGVQAVRVDPTSGALALVRLRLTLHGAQWQ